MLLFTVVVIKIHCDMKMLLLTIVVINNNCLKETLL